MNRFLVFLVFSFAMLHTCARAADITEYLAPNTPVTLFATADGDPAPSFEWFRNGVKIGEGAKLELGPFTAEKAGSYTVKATNPVGSASSDKLTFLLATPPTKPTIRFELTITATATATVSGSSATPKPAP